MIPQDAITAWSLHRPWPSRAAIEQDLLLARLIVAIYSNPELADELVFRGGTCLHQVLLPKRLRYSEDLDFVRRSQDGIGHVFDALREVAAEIGFEVKATKVGEHPKIYLRAPGEEAPGTWLRVKVEINTHETSSVRALQRVPFTVESDWFTGAVEVVTFDPAELMATKLRALYQRRKGRDLFDLWLALTALKLDPDEIIACFASYRPEGYSARRAEENLRAKVADPLFLTDLDLLVNPWPADYDVASAADLVTLKLLSRLDDARFADPASTTPGGGETGMTT